MNHTCHKLPLSFFFTLLTLGILFKVPSSFATTDLKIDLGAKVIKVHGKVLLDNKPIKVNEILPKGGQLIVGEKSFVKFHLVKLNSNVIIGASSKMNIDFQNIENKSAFELTQGSCRWYSELKKGATSNDSDYESNSNKSLVGSPNVSMGIRGTDFLFIVNEMLGESEIVLFEGEVDFKNSKNSDDHQVIHGGTWGGLGGRFGEKVKVLPSLPSNIMTFFKGQLQ